MAALPDLEIKDLRLIDALARTPNLATAAAALHVSASAVSHHIARLEERLGFVVLEGQGRSRQLSMQAQALRPLLALWQDEVAKTLGQWHDQPSRPELRLATQCYTAYHWLPDLVQRLERRPSSRRRGPALASSTPHLRIQIESTRATLSAVENRDVDLMLGWHASWPESLATRKLFEDSLALICAPTHPLAGQSHVHPRELRDHVIYVYDLESSALIALANQLFHGVALAQRPRAVRLPLTEAIVEFVKAKMGVSLLAPWAILPTLQAHQVVARPFRSRGAKRQWRAFYRADHEHRATIEATVREMKALLESKLELANAWMRQHPQAM